MLTQCLSHLSFPATDLSCLSFPTTKYLLCVSSMRTGSKHLHSLVNGGALLLVATEHRHNAPKQGGAGVQRSIPGRPAFAESSVAGFATDVVLCVLYSNLPFLINTFLLQAYIYVASIVGRLTEAKKIPMTLAL